MQNRIVVDLTFNIEPCAMAVAHYINNQAEVKDGYYYQAAPWYNCRENGIVISVGKIRGPVLNIAFFEHRNSDDICALKWTTDNFGLNPPTIESDGDKAYPTDSKYDDIAHQENYDGATAMARWIIEQIDSHTRPTMSNTHPN